VVVNGESRPRDGRGPTARPSSGPRATSDARPEGDESRAVAPAPAGVPVLPWTGRRRGGTTICQPGDEPARGRPGRGAGRNRRAARALTATTVGGADARIRGRPRPARGAGPRRWPHPAWRIRGPRRRPRAPSRSGGSAGGWRSEGGTCVRQARRGVGRNFGRRSGGAATGGHLALLRGLRPIAVQRILQNQ
jgi:hypothetical protein